MPVYDYTPRHQSPLHDLVKASKKLLPSSKRLYLIHLDTFIDGMGSSPSGWTHRRMTAFYDRLCRRVKPQTANGVIRAVQYALRAYHRDAENKPLGDFARIELHDPAIPDPRVPPSDGEALRLVEGIAACPKNSVTLRDFALVVLGLETGLRRLSLSKLEWEKIKQIEDGLTVAEVVSKGDPAFVVPISPIALLALEPWREFCAKRGVQDGTVVRRLFPVVTGSAEEKADGYRIGDGVTEQTIYNIVTTRAKRAGIRHLHPHLFRHYFSTSRSEAHIDPRVIMSVTGHAIPGMTRIASGYVDRRPFWRAAVATTPVWLERVVRRFVGG